MWVSASRRDELSCASRCRARVRSRTRLEVRTGGTPVPTRETRVLPGARCHLAVYDRSAHATHPLDRAHRAAVCGGRGDAARRAAGVAALHRRAGGGGDFRCVDRAAGPSRRARGVAGIGAAAKGSRGADRGAYSKRIDDRAAAPRGFRAAARTRFSGRRSHDDAARGRRALAAGLDGDADAARAISDRPRVSRSRIATRFLVDAREPRGGLRAARLSRSYLGAKEGRRVVSPSRPTRQSRAPASGTGTRF